MTQELLTILIADDDDSDRKQIKRVVKQAGISCDIAEASDMSEALEACNEQAFDFAILDYHMPGHNGLDGIALLHEKVPYTAIIMVTGQGDEMVASEAIKRGASEYIPKRAISSESMGRIIEHSLERAALRKKVDEQREALEQFANILTHDLSAPIRHIRGFTELLAKAVEKEEYDNIPHYYERVDKAGARMQELIDTLVQYNKITGNDITFETVSMEAIVVDAMDNLSVIIEESNAKVTHDALPEVTGNMPQLVQLIQNLIGNGIKYCEADTPTVHISAEQRENGRCIAIKDNGIGIPEKFYQAVFNPFRRLHSSDNEKYSGTGFGLATCKKIIERHNGEIWCESEEGNGTIFYFTVKDK